MGCGKSLLGAKTMSDRLTAWFRCVLLSLLVCLVPTWAGAVSKWNMPEGVTPISHDIYDLHMTIFWVCVAISVGVFGVLIYAMVYHRKSLGVKPASFHESTKVEIVWTAIPFLILVVMAIPATFVLMRMDDDSHADVNIKITGYQWKWRYEYLDQGISFFSNLSTPMAQRNNTEPKGLHYLLEVDKPLVVPIHQKIRFLVTANDVIHSWWVPDLGIKRDAIPGFIYEAWARIDKPGIYRGQCTELCGQGHGYMPIVVEAKTPNEYHKWLLAQGSRPIGVASDVSGVLPTGQAAMAAMASKKAPPAKMTLAQLQDQGKKVYGMHCAVCHKPDGVGMPPAFPALVGSKIVTGPMAAHLGIVWDGKKGTAMQAFKDQLNDQEIAAVITYQRHAWGNDDKKKYGNAAGGVLQPADVAKKRAQG